MLKDNLSTPTKRTGMASMECPAIQDEYNSTLVDSLFPEHRGKVFTYSQTPLTSPSRSYFSQKELDVLTPIRKRKTKRRNIPKVPEKILDAPDFVDDYYLNLLDWSSDNLLAVALGRTVYIWNADSGDISVLVVCSLSSLHQLLIHNRHLAKMIMYALSVGPMQGNIFPWEHSKETFCSMTVTKANLLVVSFRIHV